MNQIIYLERLEHIEYTNNPLNTLSIQMLRFLGKITSNYHSSVYLDKQNVHNPTIQKTVCESNQRLFADPKPEFGIQIIIDSNLSEHVKSRLIEYCEDKTIHSIHLLTYQDLLSYVWARITKSKNQEELFRILEKQIQDPECQYFTSRLNQTLSILIGFNEDIKMGISDNDRIGAIVSFFLFKPVNTISRSEILSVVKYLTK